MQSYLSICIPTFNRSAHLSRLLENLKHAKSLAGDSIEICISDNASIDNTQELVRKWSYEYEIVFHRNEKNIGFSNNVRNVLMLAKSPWMILVGDDDEILLDNLVELVDFLHTTDQHSWIILPAHNKTSKKGSWLSNLDAGAYTSQQFLKIVIEKGIADFGFIGCHIISKNGLNYYLKTPKEYSEDWVHLNFFLLHIYSRKHVEVYHSPIVSISPSTIDDPGYTKTRWTKLWIQRLYNLTKTVEYFNFTKAPIRLIVFRELFSPSQIREWIAFALKNPKSSARRLISIKNKVTENTKLPISIRIYLDSIITIYKLLNCAARIAS